MSSGSSGVDPEAPALGVEVLDRVLDGVAIVRRSDHVIVYANPALKALLGAGSRSLDEIGRAHV